MASQSTLRYSDPIGALYQRYANLIRDRIKGVSKITKILGTLLLTLSIICGGTFGHQWWQKRAAEKEQGKRLHRLNSGLKNKDGSRVVFVPHKRYNSKVTIYPTKPMTFDAHRRLFLNPPRASGLTDGQQNPQIPPPQTKPGLNLAFLHQFLSLLSIMIPRWSSKETGLLLSHGIFLMLRTYLSLVVARLDGEIVRDLVAGNGKAFSWGIIKWCGIGGFASYTNAMIKFLQSKVSIAFRTRLTRYIHDLYLNDSFNYYKVSNLDGGVGQGVDQFITQDLALFCASAASLYSSLGKPFVDLCVFNYQLYRSLGPLALTGLGANYFLTASILRRLSPPFGKLKAVEGRKEGRFPGSSCSSHRKRRRGGILWSWSAYGYLLSSLPIFLPAWGGLGGIQELADISVVGGRERGRMKEFITNKRLMLSLADAGGRMMYSIKDLSELAGYTSRVYTLISTLHRVHANAYFPSRAGHSELFSLADVQGTTQKGFDGVRLENVPVVAPSVYPHGGEELIDSLSMVVHSGEHLLISGSNGRPRFPSRTTGTDGIMFLPQRPYLSIGTLRDQVIYPDGELEMRSKGRRDLELKRILEEARLGYLPDREGGWDTRKEWKDVLSGGEKQRMAIARLLYHEPRYAFIDEGTSAVSSDVEGLLYETCKEKGITLITISTRASLKRYHTFNLTLGLGDEGAEWEYERIGTAREKMGVERRITGVEGADGDGGRLGRAEEKD
ncbi:hypothetical protein DID88_008561 [Monilinia fructigena]|uniref:ABC transporter domain-containing protein n=1 Tax=Monilinia fructigena TaxID=38457 RepID=A0A395J5Q3_9HELO|nr:hypothetical protein DID88_008561 [Monilinia fructigena]